MTGRPHLPYLVVMLRSLRKFHNENIIVYAWPESYEIVKTIGKEAEFNIEPRYWDSEYKGKNAQEIEKIKIVQGLRNEYDSCLYLDADLLINGNLDYMFEMSEKYGFCATQFCNWDMTCSIAYNRVKRLIGIEGIDQYMVKQALRSTEVSFNSGIFSCSPVSPVLPPWGEWTWLSRRVYISGETALHPVMQRFMPIGKATIAAGGAYNCSTLRFKPKNLKDEDVKIWHFHGDSNTKFEKSPRGARMWYPKYIEAMEENLGGIRDWVDKCKNDKHRNLAKLEEAVASGKFTI